MSNKRLDFAVNDLNPRMQGSIFELQHDLASFVFRIDGKDCCFRAFEGFRLPSRQYHLLTVDRTTKARPWESAHQYGLAVDFACRFIEGQIVQGWHWSEAAPWDDLKRKARKAGLDIPIEWDKGHVQHPLFSSVMAVLRR